MFSFLVIILLASLCNIVAAEDSELVFTFMVHRHGDRTPSQRNLKYSTNPDELEKLIEPYGYGQLTEKGLRGGYRLGQYIRAQYNDLLEAKYDEFKVYLRSTDVTRTKMTMLAALAAIFPPVKMWNKDLNWTPVPYTTVPISEDYMRPQKNCPTFQDKMGIIITDNPPEMAKYKKVFELVASQINVNITNTPLVICDIFNVLMAQVSLGMDLPPELKEHMPDITEAANAAFDYIFSQDHVPSFYSGVLLQEFLNTAPKVIAPYTYNYASDGHKPQDPQKVRIYSAHHENVYGFSKVTNTDISGMPHFESALSLNLKLERKTGKFIVESVFAQYKADGDTFVHKTLPVQGCGQPCYYQQFESLTQQYAWNYSDWINYCRMSGSI